MSVSYKPSDYHSITPHLTIKGASELMEFFKGVFDAHERSRTLDQDGRIANAEMLIGDSIMMLAEATEKYPPMPSQFYLYIPDIDATFQRGLQAGAVSIMAPADQFYGDRLAGFQDPSGNMWWLATHIEDVSPAEMQRRADEWRASQA